MQDVTIAQQLPVRLEGCGHAYKPKRKEDWRNGVRCQLAYASLCLVIMRKNTVFALWQQTIIAICLCALYPLVLPPSLPGLSLVARVELSLSHWDQLPTGNVESSDSPTGSL